MSIKASIGWADKTWNPINGRCPNACEYCYMWGNGGIGNRFARVHDHPLRLDEKILAKVPKSGTVFVGSSTDMWHPSVPDELIKRVLNICVDNQKATFLFLTKQPKQYKKFLPLLRNPNLWIGATDDGTGRTVLNCSQLSSITIPMHNINGFISFEPLLKSPQHINLSGIKWIIIGADSRRGQPNPPKEWADYLIGEARRVGAKVFIKDNYGYPAKIQELPF